MEELRIREAEGMFLAAQYWEPLSGSSAPLKSNLSSSSDDIVTDNRAPVMIRDVRVSVRSHTAELFAFYRDEDQTSLFALRKLLHTCGYLHTCALTSQ